MTVKRGILVGLGFAAGYSLWVLVLFAVRGAEPFERIGLGLTQLIVTYFACGAATGALVGFFWRYSATSLGAYAVGLVGGVTLSTGVMISLAGLPTSWGEAEVFTTGLGSVIWGIILGREIRKHRVQQQSGTE